MKKAFGVQTKALDGGRRGFYHGGGGFHRNKTTGVWVMTATK